MELERNIERKLVNGVKAMGGIAYKWVSPGNTGVPDRIVIFPDGKVEFVEKPINRRRYNWHRCANWPVKTALFASCGARRPWMSIWTSTPCGWA